MRATSEDLERLLQVMETRQLRCPHCGAADAYIAMPYFRVSEAEFSVTGTVLYGEGDDDWWPSEDARQRWFPRPILICNPCGHIWPLPEGITPTYAEYTVSPTTRAGIEAKHQALQAISDAGIRCNRCNNQIWFYLSPEHPLSSGGWVHVEGNAASSNHNGCTYAQYNPNDPKPL